MSVISLNEENFEEEVIKSNKSVIVDFYADWCGPCKMMSPIIDQIAEELKDDVKVGKINTDENLDLVQQYEIMSIPTIIVFKNGKVASTFIGLTPKEEILDSVK